MTARPNIVLLFLPTALTLARLVAVPVMVWRMVERDMDAAFLVFVLAGLSDALDGALARWLNARTEIGAWLDPLADKALLITAYVMLGLLGLLPAWMAILVVFRDVMIVGGVGLFTLISRAPAMRPLLVSKLNTVAQVLLASWTLAVAGGAIPDMGVGMLLLWAAAATTVASGGAYIWEWGRHLAGLEGEK